MYKYILLNIPLPKKKGKGSTCIPFENFLSKLKFFNFIINIS